ncbi:ABC transporter ATP-binding protein [Aureimonas altamirensis]|uniref:ABC transporter ATP-binding protein n=1 Tax=Aureimonas altamirensis TaxID=370622 RepID=UPI002036BF13|nr:ABC transporter ATP-binding protein [Aureimonas altamirensis]
MLQTTADEGAAIPVSLAGLSRRIGALDILSDIDLEVAAGEILCLVGHSGCGKSSLLRLIAGVDAPSAGQIALGGEVVAGPGRFVEPEKRGVGLMFQDYALFPHLTVRQNIAFGLRGRSRGEIAARVESTLQRLGIAHFGARYPHMLSGGEQQRVALARAIAPRPGVLLMDEPFSNLDSRLRETVRMETLALLRQIGATVVLVTHDPQEALMVSDRIALMHKGRIIQAGTGRDLYYGPQTPFVARFFSDFNEVRGTVHHGEIDTPFGRVAAGRDAAEGSEMLVLVRPGGLRPGHGDGSIEARIVHRRFCGEVEQLDIRLDAHPQLVTIRRNVGDFISGADRIRVVLDRKDAFVFPVTS